ncbi:unnamed protein product [Prunus armeniaca]|uniref:F-box domain-containing protein n=1 Tax=Prunus armeniaca TaxID=36596 RepID=A0A6J5VYV9_PRUAR|nr:unnamed protein product [Prunus armeniaca]
MMPREKKGKNPMNSKKRVAQTLAISSKQQEQWQANGPCKFLQLQRALVMDILSRLTINTLFNCRCVCKAWLSLISDPQFAHLCISRSPIGILIKTFPPKSITRRLDFAQIEESADSRWRLEKMRFTPKTSLPISEFNLMNSCNGLICLSGPERGDLLYVCNPVLGEFITIERSGKGRPSFNCVGLGFSVGTGEYKVLQTFLPSSEPVTNYNYEAEIYTIGTGFWRSIGKASWSLGPQLPFNAYLHGALHWISCFGDVPELINSFNFETEQFQSLPPPSYFGPLQKQFSDCLKLGVWEGCLVLCVFGDDSSKFVMWVMKDYGVQESWTKTFVIENLYPRELSCDLYEPMLFLSNGEIVMSYNDWVVVCYNQKRMSFRETRITRTRSEFHAIGYSPCFVSLYDISKAEEVKRVQGSKNCDKLSAEGSFDYAGSGMPRHKSTKLSSGYAWPAFEEGLPNSMNSSATTISFQPDFTAMGFPCARCGEHLGHVFRGKGFPLCQRCSNAGSS